MAQCVGVRCVIGKVDIEAFLDGRFELVWCDMLGRETCVDGVTADGQDFHAHGIPPKFTGGEERRTGTGERVQQGAGLVGQLSQEILDERRGETLLVLKPCVKRDFAVGLEANKLPVKREVNLHLVREPGKKAIPRAGSAAGGHHRHVREK